MANITNSINIVQSVWSRGITDELIQGRSDTDILAKGAQEIENLIMLEQGGLRKRPGMNLLNNYGIPSITTNLIQSFFIPSRGEIIIIWGRPNTNDSTYIYDLNNSSLNAVLSNLNAYSAVQDGNVILSSNGKIWTTIKFNSTSQEIIYPVFDNFPYAVRTTTEQGDINIIKKTGAMLNDYFYDGEEVYLIFPTSFANITQLYFLYCSGLYLKVTVTTIPIPGEYGVTCNVLLDSSFNVKVSKTYSLGNPSITYYGITTNIQSSLLTTRGWAVNYSLPKYLSLFQNRLWCSNIDSYNDANYNIKGDNKTIWASGISDDYNFLAYQTNPDSPLSVILSGNSSPIINNLFAGTTISALTNNGIFTFINQTNSSITPTNFFIQKQNSHPSDNILPVEYDQQLYYVQSNKSNIRALSYNTTESLQNDNNTTILSSSLIKNPTHMCQLSSLDNTDDAYLFVLCEDNGLKYIACHQSLKSQNIYGWTKWTFDYQIVAITSINNRLFAFVESYGLCEFKFNNKYDINLNNKIKCKMKTNLYSMRDQITGDLLFKRKKIGKINVLIYNTDSVIINGVKHDVNNFDSNYEENKTKIIESNQSINWAKFDSVTIEHESENDFTLLSLGVELII